VGGTDAALFSIDAATGALSFNAAPDYEAPADANADNVYDVTVQVSDGTFTDTQAIAITVIPVNDQAPVITSDGGGATATVSVAENATAVTTVTASDGDLPAQTLTYSIAGGADAARFSINATTGALSFNAAPDYEAPADANGDNVYDVTVQASDGTLTDTQAIAVTVTPVNEQAPVITSDGGGATATVSVAENATAVTTVTATDGDLPAQTLIYSIVGGADAALFSINATTGALSFNAAPDYEAPADANADNVYDVTVQASDGTLTDTQGIAVTVTPVNDQAPVITSDGGGATATVSVAENATAVTTVTATDGDLPAQTLAYSIVGGADAALFSINATTGALSFNAAPDYEAPADANGDNVYDVTVQASDGALTDTQAIAVTVTPVNEQAPVITSDGGGATATVSVAENATAVTTVTATDADLPAATLTYSIVGGTDAALFSIDAATGALSFNAAPDYEAPADANADNVYDVTVQVSDGTLTDTQAIVVTVTPVNDQTPVITSDGGGAVAKVSVDERLTNVTTVVATDGDLPAQKLSYAIVGGADAALFNIDPSTGALAFINAPHHDSPVDADADNIYEVIVQASDGTFTTTQNLSVTVTEVTDIVPGKPLPGIVDTTVADQVHTPRSISGPPNDHPVPPSPSYAPDSVTASAAKSAPASSFALYHASPVPIVNAVQDTLRSSRGALAGEEAAIKLWWAGVQAVQHSHDRAEQEWRISPDSYVNPPGNSDESGAYDQWVLHAGLVSLSVGVTWWTGRSSGLLASVLASVRAWQSFDLLPVLKRDQQEKRLLLEQQRRDEDDEDVSGPRPSPARAPAMQLEADE
jgi:serralysin